MRYPLVSEYIDSVMLAENNFATLTNLRPIVDENNHPLYITEGTCVIFKMKDNVSRKIYGVKCFLTDQSNRQEWYHKLIQGNLILPQGAQLLEDELYVDSDVSDQEEFPIFVYPWNETTSLIDFIETNKDNKHTLGKLAFHFGQVVKWARDNNFIWNYLDASNLCVSADGRLEFTNIDELLLDNYEEKEYFASDDIPLVMILLSLKSISLNAELFDYGTKKSHLLFDNADRENLAKSEIIQKIIQLDDNEINSLIGYLLICLYFNSNNGINSAIFSLKASFESELEELIYYSEKGDAAKQVELARLYYKQENYDQAFRWYEEAARQGNPDGINGMGICYKLGCGVEKDEVRAVKLFSKSADEGSEKGLYNLAMAYYSGKGVELDWEKAFGIFKSLAEKGEQNSQYMIGKYLMLNHLGSISLHIVSRRNTKGAFGWFKKSAKQGHSGAQQQLGMFYESGTDPCIRNLEKALEWYQKAANQGNREAMFAIGRLYANGIDEQSPDFQKAYSYFIQAAEEGHSEAQYRVGVALYYGKGISIDKDSARFWLEKSASKKNEAAQKLLNQIDSEGTIVDNNSTLVTKGEMANAKMDKYGVLYSEDGKKLLHYGIDDLEDDFGGEQIKQQSFKQYKIPEGVEIICDDAFSECESIEEIILPSTIRLIGNAAFYKCVNLLSITIPEGVKSIEFLTFGNCSSLHNLVLPHSLEYIEPGALTSVKSIESYSPNFIERDGCLYSSDSKTLIYCFNDGRTSFEVPYGIERIGSYAFKDSAIQNIYIPYSVKSIGEAAFSGCEQLQDMELPSSITEIGVGAFVGCSNLFNVKLPNKLKCIEVQLFDHCRNLTHIQIPDGVEEISNMAFMSTNIGTIILPKDLKKLGGMAFAGAPLSYLESNSSYFMVNDMTIYSSDGKVLVQYYGNHEKVVIPNTVTKIADFAFAFAYSIKELVIPDSVEEIGKSFLLEISPEKIIVPSKLKQIVAERISSWSHNNIIVSE